MKVLILGAEGYIGRALYHYLSEEYEVYGVDNYARQRNTQEVGAQSLFPVERNDDIQYLNVCDYEGIRQYIKDIEPDAVVHLAEQPSAPFSMKDYNSCSYTQLNNIQSTLNLLWIAREVPFHLVKLGTMGVYGTPQQEIPETNEPIAYNPASFYHNSKAFDSINIRKACEWWGVSATDLHQGVVYGHLYDTRFDYDSYFGTVVNRFLTQAAMGHPLTVYGKGGQTRGFIHLQNTLECIELAINNPSEGYEVFNQITEIFSINEIANLVSRITGAEIDHIDNPRLEAEDHVYEVKAQKLLDLGLNPIKMENSLWDTYKQVLEHKSNIDKDIILPKTKWS